MNQTIPPWLKNYFYLKDLGELSELIGRIEKTTQVELVPLVVRSSVDRTQFKFLLRCLAILSFLVSRSFFIDLLGWNSSLTITIVSAILILTLLFFAEWFSNSHRFLKIFYHPDAIQEAVFQRACGEFFKNQLHRTESRTAVLFMYSILERKAMIIADPNLHSIETQLWQNAIQCMVNAAKSKKLLQGFKSSFELVANFLSTSNPPNPIANKNELSDSLIVKE